VSELMRSFGKVRGESKDFKTASKVKAHVKHREKAGWVFEKKDAESEDPFFKVTNI